MSEFEYEMKDGTFKVKVPDDGCSFCGTTKLKSGPLRRNQDGTARICIECSLFCAGIAQQNQNQKLVAADGIKCQFCGSNLNIIAGYKSFICFECVRKLFLPPAQEQVAQEDPEIKEEEISINME